MSDFGQTTTFI